MMPDSDRQLPVSAQDCQWPLPTASGWIRPAGGHQQSTRSATGLGWGHQRRAFSELVDEIRTPLAAWPTQRRSSTPDSTAPAPEPLQILRLNTLPVLRPRRGAVAPSRPAEEGRLNIAPPPPTSARWSRPRPASPRTRSPCGCPSRTESRLTAYRHARPPL